MKSKIVAFVLTIAWCANCLAYKDSRSFEDLLSVWADRMSWTDEGAFSLKLVKECPPSVFHPGRFDQPISVDNGELRLSHGDCYLLTNGHGRKQTFHFIDPIAVEGTEGQTPMVE